MVFSTRSRVLFFSNQTIVKIKYETGGNREYATNWRCSLNASQGAHMFSLVITFRNFIQITGIAIAVVIVSWATSDSALGSSPATSAGTTTSDWTQIRKKIRVRTFSEWMSPAFEGAENSVPSADGQTTLDPTNIFNILWTDYEFKKNFRFLYFQRFQSNLTGNASAPSGTAWSDPRFALRITDFFPSRQWTTTLDLYYHAPTSDASRSIGRSAEIGAQWAGLYLIPQSRWSVGFLTDVRKSFYNSPGNGGNYWSGFVAPRAQYEFNSKWSTQHWLVTPYRQIRADGSSLDANWRWGYPFNPFVQNGVGWSASQNVWLGLFVNNYLGETPRLSNTWASAWLSLTVL